MTTLVIRTATGADVGALAGLRRAWAAEQSGDLAADPDLAAEADFDRRLAAWYERESARRVTWLALAGDDPAGMLNLALFERMPHPGRPPSRWGYLANAFVRADHRNQGIGRQLLHAAIDYADRSELLRVVLSPSDRSIPFYQRAGFGPADALMQRPRRI